MNTAIEYTVRSGTRGDTGPMAYAAKVAALNAHEHRIVTVTDSTGAAVDVRFDGDDLITTNVTQPDLFAAEQSDPIWINQLRKHIKQTTNESK